MLSGTCSFCTLCSLVWGWCVPCISQQDVQKVAHCFQICGINALYRISLHLHSPSSLHILLPLPRAFLPPTPVHHRHACPQPLNTWVLLWNAFRGVKTPRKAVNSLNFASTIVEMVQMWCKTWSKAQLGSAHGAPLPAQVRPKAKQALFDVRGTPFLKMPPFPS